MERHDSMTRAARYLLGAGTLAAAMVALTANSASAQLTECVGGPEGDANVCGHVFTDTSNDGYTTGEGVSAIVVIKDGSGPVGNSPTPTVDCANDGSDSCGYFVFLVPPGTYDVCLVAEGTTACLNTPVSVTVTETDQNDHVVNIPLGSGGGNSGGPVDAEPPYTIYGSGTGTPGYWKNHKEAWPKEGVEIGGVKYLNQATAVLPDKTITDAIKLMGKVSGDKTFSMFSALIAAKLNTMALLGNNFDCVAGTMSKADTWMTQHPVGSGVKASSDAWQEGEPWHQKLDDYNNGKLCAPHRD